MGTQLTQSRKLTFIPADGKNRAFAARLVRTAINSRKNSHSARNLRNTFKPTFPLFSG